MEAGFWNANSRTNEIAFKFSTELTSTSRLPGPPAFARVSRVKAATPELQAKAGRTARELRLGKPRFPPARSTRFSLPTKISKTTPCKVTGGAGLDALRDPAKTL